MPIIEFTGMPGAGKSTIQCELVNRMQLLGRGTYLTAHDAFLCVARAKGDMPFRTLLNLLPWPLAKRFVDSVFNRTRMEFHAQNRFLSRHGLALKAFLESKAFCAMPEIERMELIDAFLQVGTLTVLVQEYLPKSSVVFLDEGLIQKSLMFISRHSEALEDDLVRIYLDAIPIPSILVNVSADFNTCKQRMMTRPKGLTKRLGRMPEAEVDSFLERIYEHLEKSKKYMHSRAELTVLELDSRQPLNDVVSMLATLIIQ